MAKREAGCYLDGQRLVPLKSQPDSPWTVSVPPLPADHLCVELRCRGWSPRGLMPGSQDARTLGIQVFSVTLRAEGAAAGVFDANQGEWLEPPPAAKGP